MKSVAFLLSTSALLTACGTGRLAPPQVLQACPKPPPLELNLPQAALDESFTARMANFLHGKLPEPISYDLPLGSVKLSTAR